MSRCPFAMLAALTSGAAVIAALATVALRALGHDWHGALALTLALVVVRLALMARAAARRELPWSRLLLPAIIVLEAVGLAWRGGAALWLARLGTAAALELALVVVAIRTLRRTRAGDEPPEARIARALAALLPPRVARLAAFELVIVGSALRFALGGWRRAVPAGFSYHRGSGLRMLLPLLPLLALGDVLLLELVLLPRTAPWLRAVVHGLGIYGLVWLVGLYASARARPHRLADGRLVLHRGMLARLVVAVDQIATIAPLPAFADDWKRRAHCKGAARLDLAGAAVLELHLHGAARPTGVLGDGAPTTRVLIAVDDPAALTAALLGQR